jgi:hypothetical protein
MRIAPLVMDATPAHRTLQESEAAMSTWKIALRSVVPALIVAASVGYSHTASAAEQCVLEKIVVTSVAPYQTQENDEYASYTRLRGAQFYVPAREGLTPEWLTLSVQRAISKKDASACRPDVGNVKVSVLSAGGGFWVRLTTEDERAAQSLVNWAQSAMAIAPTQHASVGAK